VKLSPSHSATGLDIDREALAYAKVANLSALPREAQKRVSFLEQNVLKPTRSRFDWIGAFNFSFFVFHRRDELLRYARAARRSLNPKGTLFLELAGGPGFTESGFERKSVRLPGGKKINQVWETHPYDPVTAVGDYSIHFQLPNRQWLNDAFTYHWRIWGIREVREVLEEAGFRKTVVLWQTCDTRGRPSGEFLPSEAAEAQNSWVAYVIGCR
jgi:SAM-dependent methyltransferase